MIPVFGHDVDGKPRNNKRLLPHRNWCSIREYVPGSTPPPTPRNPHTISLRLEHRSGDLVPVTVEGSFADFPAAEGCSVAQSSVGRMEFPTVRKIHARLFLEQAVSSRILATPRQ